GGCEARGHQRGAAGEVHDATAADVARDSLGLAAASSPPSGVATTAASGFDNRISGLRTPGPPECCACPGIHHDHDAGEWWQPRGATYTAIAAITTALRSLRDSVHVCHYGRGSADRRSHRFVDTHTRAGCVTQRL